MKILSVICAALMLIWAPDVRAEANEVRIAMPYGLVYLPVYVTQDRHLIEKYAAASGLGDINVSVRNMSSGPVTSDLILAGEADIGMGGWGPAFIMWDKTKGTRKVKAIMPLSSSQMVLLSVDPRVQSLRDLREGDKIGVSAIKVTDQAVSLQMAAAKEWGWAERFRLDPLTTSISNPDGMAALLSGGSEIKNHLTIVPFSVIEEESGKTHRVWSSDQTFRPGTSGTLMYASGAFHDGSPKLYAATVAAFEEAIRFIAEDPKTAAEIYVHHEPQKRETAWVERIIRDPKLITYSSTPRGMKEHADFMADIGTLKNRPEHWRDLFWDNMKDRDGD